MPGPSESSPIQGQSLLDPASNNWLVAAAIESLQYSTVPSSSQVYHSSPLSSEEPPIFGVSMITSGISSSLPTSGTSTFQTIIVPRILLT